MGPVKGEHNTPATVPQAVDAIAKLRNMDAVELKNVIRQNFRELFNL
jgi:Tat protein secretion system quality control protein TatD with DNase activity